MSKSIGSVGYLTFVKHAEKVVKNICVDRPEIFKGIYHKDGKVYVTDTYRVYIAKSVYNAKEGSTTCITTGKELEGNYPNVEAVIPGTGSEIVSFMIPVGYALDSLKAMQQIGTIPTAPGESKTKKAKVLFNLDFSGNVVKISTLTKYVNSAYEVTTANTLQQDLRVTVNANYMIQALDMFKDFLSSVKGNPVEVEVRIYGKNAAVVVDYENILTAVIMPTRLHD